MMQFKKRNLRLTLESSDSLLMEDVRQPTISMCVKDTDIITREKIRRKFTQPAHLAKKGTIRQRDTIIRYIRIKNATPKSAKGRSVKQNRLDPLDYQQRSKYLY